MEEGSLFFPRDLWGLSWKDLNGQGDANSGEAGLEPFGGALIQCLAPGLGGGAGRPGSAPPADHSTSSWPSHEV